MRRRPEEAQRAFDEQVKKKVQELLDQYLGTL